MTPITFYIDPATEAGLRHLAEEDDCSCEELAALALSEMILRRYRERPCDPGRAQAMPAPPAPSAVDVMGATW